MQGLQPNSTKHRDEKICPLEDSVVRWAGIDISAPSGSSAIPTRNQLLRAAYLQQLFHIEAFRTFVLSIDVSTTSSTTTGANTSTGAKAGGGGGGKEDSIPISRNVKRVCELQRLFRTLQTVANIPTHEECQQFHNPALRVAIPIIRNMLLSTTTTTSNGSYAAITSSTSLLKSFNQRTLPAEDHRRSSGSQDHFARLLYHAVAKMGGKDEFRRLMMIPMYASFNCFVCRKMTKIKYVEAFKPIRVRSWSSTTTVNNLQDYFTQSHNQPHQLKCRSEENRLVCSHCSRGQGHRSGVRRGYRALEKTEFRFDKFPRVMVLQLDVNAPNKQFHFNRTVDLLPYCGNNEEEEEKLVLLTKQQQQSGGRKKRNKKRNQNMLYDLQGIIARNDGRCSNNSSGSTAAPSSFISYVREKKIPSCCTASTTTNTAEKSSSAGIDSTDQNPDCSWLRFDGPRVTRSTEYGVMKEAGLENDEKHEGAAGIGCPPAQYLLYVRRDEKKKS